MYFVQVHSRLPLRTKTDVCVVEVPELWGCSSTPGSPEPWSAHCCQRRLTHRGAGGLWEGAGGWEPQGLASHLHAHSYSSLDLDRNLKQTGGHLQKPLLVMTLSVTFTNNLFKCVHEVVFIGRDWVYFCNLKQAEAITTANYHALALQMFQFSALSL